MVRKPLWLSQLWIIPLAMVINSVSLASPFLSVKFVAAFRGRPHRKNQTKTGSIIVGNYADKSWSSNQKKETYCGWKKSCTTLDGWNPINDGINMDKPPVNWCRISKPSTESYPIIIYPDHVQIFAWFLPLGFPNSPREIWWDVHPPDQETCCRIVPRLLHFAHTLW